MILNHSKTVIFLLHVHFYFYYGGILSTVGRGGSRIYKRRGWGGLTQGFNLLDRGVQSTLPSMLCMLGLGHAPPPPPPQENFEK